MALEVFLIKNHYNKIRCVEVVVSVSFVLYEYQPQRLSFYELFFLTITVICCGFSDLPFDTETMWC